MSERRELLFVSTRFLFPVDSGGKIRTTQILRGMKGGPFSVTLVSPGTAAQESQYASDLESVCDRFESWLAPSRGPFFPYTRMRHLASALPIPVRTDRQAAGVALVERLLGERPAAAVFDFAHAAVLAPALLSVPAVMFTHNVEAEIFKRHYEVARNPVIRGIWKNQYRKMLEFERTALKRFDVVVAVADRDRKQFVDDYAVDEPFVIPTGVDLDFFTYAAPERSRDVVFCGSMDWLANQEAVAYFMDEVWARIVARVPDARMTVVGRAPPSGLVEAATRRGLAWRFTGFVDDVRPYVQGAAVSVIPLRVGGGTRLKVYEAMAMGSPVVSTPVGVEGLPVGAGTHYLEADGPEAFASAVADLLQDAERRERIARAARSFVEQRFSFRVAARAFEEACKLAIARRGNAPASVASYRSASCSAHERALL